MESEPQDSRELTIKEAVDLNREDIQSTADVVKAIMGNSEFQRLPASANEGEIKANVMLAYRHLEDARMRLGKVIQAYEGGVSVYDKPK